MPQKSGVQRIFPTCENTCTDKRTEVRDDSNAGDNRHRFTTTAGYAVGLPLHLANIRRNSDIAFQIGVFSSLSLVTF
ncbi:hypothetical protein CEXT_354601 [Caerostris extrusa]|uniref:Uncharacterized protein n=1 Tax=Caerostris extrusa TaxID=172846 RepID=A0AAV4RDE6_CAEEX|nr:hypothetical protein CEXT_354601 [Caerostris extrusa]